MDKEFLNQYREIDQHITRLIEKKEQLFTQATRVTPQLSDMPRGGGRSVEDTYSAMIDIDLEINFEIDKLVNTKLLICREIAQIKDANLKKVLGYRYIKKWTDKRGQKRIGCSYKYIAKVMGITPRWVIKLHSKYIHSGIGKDVQDTIDK